MFEIKIHIKYFYQKYLQSFKDFIKNFKDNFNHITAMSII